MICRHRGLPKAHKTHFQEMESDPAWKAGMGTSCKFDLVAWVLFKPLKSRALIVVQSDSLAALIDNYEVIFACVTRIDILTDNLMYIHFQHSDRVHTFVN